MKLLAMTLIGRVKKFDNAIENFSTMTHIEQI